MEIPIRFVKGIGPKRERLLKKLGIFSLQDLLYYFPSKYQDRRKVSLISELKEGSPFLIQAEVITLHVRRTFPKRKFLVEALLKDSSGYIQSIWFNQPYLEKYLKKAHTYYFYGRVQRYKNTLYLVSPEFEDLSSEGSLGISGILSFYRLSQQLSQKTLRNIIYNSLNRYGASLVEPLPFEVRREFSFPNIRKALNSIHFPSSFEELKEARRRFIFEEFFFLQILIYRRKAEIRIRKRSPLIIKGEWIEKVKKKLPFTLTSEQEKALSEIISDITSPYRNARLLQGDVGSGKTVVVAIVSFLVAMAGFQTAFMVPTEVLAFQHKDTLRKLSRGLNIKIESLSGGVSSKKRKKIFKEISQGKIDIIVGTHALLNEELKFEKLRFIVIDEQHRFGVSQRALLSSKGEAADVVVMSATPIPRSLALTLYGDLEVSLIRGYPQGRKFPLVRIVKEEDRQKIYEFIKEKVRENQQAYIVYALVEEEDADLYSAVRMYEKLTREFRPFKVGLLHGRMSSSEKEKVLRDFKKSKIHILVSTSVVEVGVDVPQATVMVIENPERFGLAQLHQLRGRIMRSVYQPYFFMIVKENISPSSQRRLTVILKSCDGFRIAEEDLKLRGPGDLLGTIQAGYLPKSILQAQEDIELLKKARFWAFKIIKKDPYLQLREHQNIRKILKERENLCILWPAG